MSSTTWDSRLPIQVYFAISETFFYYSMLLFLHVFKFIHYIHEYLLFVFVLCACEDTTPLKYRGWCYFEIRLC